MSLFALGLAFYAVLSLFSMATMSIGAGVLGIVLVFEFSRSKKWNEVLRRFSNNHFNVIRQYLAVSLLLVFACLASLVFGHFYPLSFGGKFSEIHFFSDIGKLWYLFWPIILWVALTEVSESERTTIMRAWLVTFIVLSAVGIAQHFTGWPRPQEIPGVPGRFHATLFLGHHLSVASVFIFPFFVLLDFFRSGIQKTVHSVSSKPLLPIVLMGFGLVCGLTTLFFTYSRTLWIAVPIGFLCWILFQLKSRNRWIAGFVLLGISLGLSQVPLIHDRLTANMGIHEREDLWEANLKMFEARPITGVGLKHNQELSGYYLMEKYHASDVFSGHAHNNILDFLGGTGLMGLIAFVIWWAFVFKCAVQNRVKIVGVDLTLGIVCAMIVYQINGLTQVNFWEGKVQHQLMWVIALILFSAASPDLFRKEKVGKFITS